MTFPPPQNIDILLPKKITNSVTLVLKVGEIIMNLESNDVKFIEYIQKYYCKFQSSEKPAYVIKIHGTDDKLKWGNFTNENFIYGSIDFDGIFFYRQSRKENVIEFVLPISYKDWEIDNILKLYFSRISLKHNILLLHASAIIKNGKAVLFTGQSGAGKSTISNLSGYPVFHDDIIAISILEDNKFYLRTIPFKTNYENKIFIGEIEGFYRIFQSQTTYIEEINKREQLMHFLFSVWNFDKFQSHSNIGESEILDYCITLLQHVNVKKLYFTKTDDFLQFI